MCALPLTGACPNAGFTRPKAAGHLKQKEIENEQKTNRINDS